MLNKILNIVSTTIVVIAVIIAILLGGLRIFGLHPYAVTSGSMEPKIHVGSVVYVARADTEKLEVGDIITFKLDGDLMATHRIVGISEEDGHLMFQTKGDANEATDGRPVDSEDVVGKVVFSIPLIGAFGGFISTGRGKLALICGALILIIIVTLSEYLSKTNE